MNVGVVRGAGRGLLWAISMGTSCPHAEQNAFITTPSSSPSTPQHKSRGSSARRSLASRFSKTRSQREPICSSQAASPACKKPPSLNSPALGRVWRSLGVDQSELSLALSLPTGQSFRWKLTAESEYTGVVDHYLFTLRQTPNDVEYLIHNVSTPECHNTYSIDANGENAGNMRCECHTLCDCKNPLNGGRPALQKSASHDPHVSVGAALTLVARHETCDHQAHYVDTDGKGTTHECPNKYKGHQAHVSQTHDPHLCAVCVKRAEASLKDYLNLNTSLKDVWAPFVAADARFAALAPHMAGARLLRQQPLECLFQFICSSNNHIQRISKLVDYLASLGPYLGTVQGLSFYAFPSLDTLAKVTEGELRKVGFGYRAKYIVGAVKELQSKENGGEQWLYSLRASTLENALKELCFIPGIGPKVAACIALFSLDQHHAIPVDTHVWQIATTYITPELSGERLTAKLHTAVSEAFVTRFGKYAGWAQNVLFIAELSSHQLYLPEHLRTSREKKLKGTSRKKAKV